MLICHDFDVPSRADDVNQPDREIPSDLPRVDFFHWLLVDLPPTLTQIAEGEFSRGFTPRGKPGPGALHGARQGLNDYTGWFAGDAQMAGNYFGYDGPFPPFNDSLVHHYVFTLYATTFERMPRGGHVHRGAGARGACRQGARGGHALGHLHPQPPADGVTQQATRILATRHGQTAWNATLRIQGQLDIGLNDVGRWQAQRLAQAWPTKPSTPSTRATWRGPATPRKRWPARRAWRCAPTPGCASAASASSRA